MEEPPTPEVLAAIRDKKLLPVAQLDRGFVYPDYPSQVIVSYFQAGSICDFIEEKWGEDKLLDMVHSYAQLKTTPQVIQQNLGLAPEEFDKQYLAWIDQKYGAEAAHFDEWREKLKALVAAAKQKQYDAVLQRGTCGGGHVSRVRGRRQRLRIDRRCRQSARAMRKPKRRC